MPSDQNDSLPGEFDDQAQEDALKAWGLKLVMESIDGIDDAYLANLVAIYHEEWERRHGEKWVISE